MSDPYTIDSETADRVNLSNYDVDDIVEIIDGEAEEPEGVEEI